MARNSFVFAALIYWLLDISKTNGCQIDYTCRRTAEQCMTMENVALGKMAEVSSFYSSASSSPACVVVNGDRSNWFTGGANEDNCVHTNSTDYTGWWQVHLGRNYTIKDITVYSQTLGYRLSEVRVTIDGELCYDFPSQTSNDALSNISCNTPLTGSTVRFEKRQRASRDAYYLVLCEVEIWVCRPGLYGPSCSDRCNCENNDTCDNYYGTCPNVCPDYSYGFNCSSQCGHCRMNGTCNTTTGECHQGCDPGWTSVFCNQTCPVGSYGQNCNTSCGFCESTNILCEPVNGHCPNGCEDGYQPPLCDKTCTNNTYGKNCSLTCGSCASFPCDTVTGRCDQCRENFVPPLCDECLPRWYGESCSQICVNCAGNQSCHRVTGLCDVGCLAGWESSNCSTHCTNNTYGKNCNRTCGHCASFPCDTVTGHCDQCRSNFIPPLCDDLSSIEGTTTAIIVGVLVPFVVVLIVVAVVVFILRRIRRKRKQNTTSGLVELPVIPKECITPSQSQVVTKDTDDVSETLNNYDTLQTGTPEKSIYSALTSRECGSVTKDDPCYYNT